MALTHEYIYVFTVQCDGCLKRTKASFHKIVAIARAKKAGYERFELGEKKEVFWFCKTCLKAPHIREQLSTKAPPPVRQVVQVR